ncbi:MAG: asparagine synthase (glutamine-hydrolyzing), partial [Myxococcaceae bacterium]|nr:asparagine synthase (glutamine-hydrolyzing) [Myxococcaceae bacterium]
VRLALVDLTDRGQQPLWSADGRVAIVFNGEMYNHAEHRARLKAKGFTFKSDSDTEVVLALYLERGLEFVEAVRGMFALAVLDFRERGLEATPKLVLARDPFGIKPLYLTRRGEGLCFASELRALVTAKLASTQVNREALADYLTFGFVLQPRTMLEGVTMLERGTVRVEEAGKPTREHRFWLMPAASDRGEDFRAASLRLREVLEDSVRLHALADAPVGAFLSGGVDSSSIVALMAKHNAKLRTYTLKLKDAAQDESHYARDFAEQLGCVHTELEVGDGEVADLYVRFGAALDQPSTDGFNTWLISRAAARDVKGVVSGLGGDEWFGGYPVIQRMKYLGGAVQAAGRVASRLGALVPDSLGELAARAQSRASPLEMWSAAHRVFREREVAALIGHAAGSGAERLARTLDTRLGDLDPVDLGCQLDVWAYMGCQLLRDSDVTSMASSLELRVPLVDVEVAAAARSIDARHKVERGALPPSKRVLVEAVRDVLPADIHQRPKRGFALPYAAWVDGPLQGLSRELRSSLSRRGLLADVPARPGLTQTWALMALELWCAAMEQHARA